MKKYVTAVAVAAGILAAGAASAQTPPATTTPQDFRRLAVVDERQAVLRTIEVRPATGRPYSAEAVTEAIQSLGDGNRIERETVTRIYRDGQGRTRRETLTRGGVTSVSISDPVAHVNYILDPQKRTAYRTGGVVALPSTVPPSGFGGRARSGGAGTGSGAGSGRAVDTGQVATTARGGGGGARGAAAAPPLVDAQPADTRRKKEDLGQQTIEGVAARGTRTTTIIPAGSIGNLQDIRIVSEQWFSDDLQVLVLTKHNDPRSGETIYRLRNIVRAEPDASLFTVPADYTVQQGGGGRGRGGQ